MFINQHWLKHFKQISRQMLQHYRKTTMIVHRPRNDL